MAIYLLYNHLGHDGMQVAAWKEWGYVHMYPYIRRETLNLTLAITGYQYTLAGAY